MKPRVTNYCKVLFLLTAILSSSSAWSMLASDLSNLKVIGYHYTNYVSSDSKMYYSKTPSENRIIVFKLSAIIPSADGILFSKDLLLRYFESNEKEHRSSAIRICSSETSIIGEENSCLVSRNGWIHIGTGDVIFTAAFLIPNEAKNIELLRVGDANSTPYRLTDKRTYSVHITTNQGIQSIGEIIEVIKAGGYRTFSPSTKLNKDVEGITIYYGKTTETLAREISQRIMTKSNIAPTVKESDLGNSDTDIVIWIGK